MVFYFPRQFRPLMCPQFSLKTNCLLPPLMDALVNLGRIYFEIFQEEEYLEYVFQTPLIPVQMEQILLYSGIKFRSLSRSITIIPAMSAVSAITLSVVE